MRITRHGQLIMKDDRRGYLPAAKVFWWPGIIETAWYAQSYEEGTLEWQAS